MEPYISKISLLISILSLFFLNSISPSLSEEISPLSSISDAPAESPNSNDPSEDNPFLEEICKSTDYPTLCIETIAPFLKGKTDIISVLDAAMKSNLEATKLAILLAKKMATTPGISPAEVSMYKDCEESFEEAKENIEQAIGGLPIRDIGLMNSMLSAVITDVSDCEDKFSGSDSPFAADADKIVNMTSNCLAIVSLIPEHMKYASLG